MRKIPSLNAVLVLALTLSSCGGSGSTPPPPPPPPPPPTCPAGTFCMGSSIFYTTASLTQPVTLTAATNAAVTWTNDSGVLHDVTFDTPSAALAVNGGSGNISGHTAGSNQRKFAAPGTYQFHCVQHGTQTTGMRGTVVVH